MTSRRNFLASSAAFLSTSVFTASVGQANSGTFEITLTPAQWRKRLTPAQFAVLREEATERAFTNSLLGESSELLSEKRTGNYHCAGCDLAVYPSSTKYESGTGWPSFWDSLSGAVGTKADNTLFTRRTEVHCRRCGGHFGHVFEDGPAPTGKRHCLNGLALTFRTG